MRPRPLPMRPGGERMAMLPGLLPLPLPMLPQPRIRGRLRRRHPLATGLSSWFLYRTPREYGLTDIVDDVCGTPSGHFVVIAAYDRAARRLLVSDPYGPHPYGGSRDYWIRMDRVFNAILLGIVPHGANVLVRAPRGNARGKRP